jgi:hypothetical protein
MSQQTFCQCFTEKEDLDGSIFAGHVANFFPVITTAKFLILNQATLHGINVVVPAYADTFSFNFNIKNVYQPRNFSPCVIRRSHSSGCHG